MQRTFIYTTPFDKKWFSLNLNDDDQRELELELLDNPDLGTVEPGTGGMRKFRFSSVQSNKGKSGSYRVNYLNINKRNTTFLIFIFAKGDQESLTQEQKNVLKKIAIQIKQEFN